MQVVNKFDAVDVFADGADLESIRSLSADVRIRGFTTNPSLMKKSGVKDYLGFARKAIELIGDRPVSFEVLSDEKSGMVDQGLRLSSLAKTVNVKIPITNTQGVFSGSVVRELSSAGVPVNITAVFTREQIEMALEALEDGPPGYISVFAGRIADTGRDPVPVMADAVRLLSDSSTKLIWASPREVLNYYQAAEVGCHIITMTPDLIGKLDLFGKDLDQFSLETVQMFVDDARNAELSI